MSRHQNKHKELVLQQVSEICELLTNQNGLLSFSFKYYIYGTNYGQSFEQWQDEEILADLDNKLKDFSAKRIVELLEDGILELYDSFPKGSKFNIPPALRGMDTEVQWARLSITGARRIGGFIVKNPDNQYNNIFYIVYLDKDHEFAPCKKK